MQSRGQLWSVEFIFTTILFSALILLLLTTFSNVDNLVNGRISEKRGFDLAFNVSDMLVFSKGVPENWQDLNINDVNIIGLAKTDNEISVNKLQTFLDYNSQYDVIKSKLGLGGYDLYIGFLNAKNSDILYEFGIEPEKSHRVYSVTRYAVLDSNTIKIVLKVFK